MKKMLAVFLILFSSLSLHATTQEFFSMNTEKKHEITLYYFDECPFCQKVLSYLNETGKKVPMKNTRKSADAKAELKEIGGKTQVPCLVIDGKPLYESDDIVEWFRENESEIE